MRLELLLSFVLFCFLISISSADTELDKKKNAKLPPCGSCTNLVSSFDKAMEITKRGKFEGGDTAWEEKSQPRYATSEVRFIEITEELLCKDLARGENQCHQNHNQWEEHLETWWKMESETRPSLREYLCVDTLKVCCPQDHYGPECTKCSVLGENEKICSGNGKCKGGGTRKGNGQCACDKEYAGKACDQCSIGHYSSFKEGATNICSACHKACADHCSGPGPKSCLKCAMGYEMHTEHGCMDIDECILSKPCAKNKFCVNTEGTFKCMSCDKACASCDGDGPDNCQGDCADDYRDRDGVCVREKGAGGKEKEVEETPKEEL